MYHILVKNMLHLLVRVYFLWEAKLLTLQSPELWNGKPQAPDGTLETWVTGVHPTYVPWFQESCILSIREIACMKVSDLMHIPHSGG